MVRVNDTDIRNLLWTIYRPFDHAARSLFGFWQSLAYKWPRVLKNRMHRFYPFIDCFSWYNYGFGSVVKLPKLNEIAQTDFNCLYTSFYEWSAQKSFHSTSFVHQDTINQEKIHFRVGSIVKTVYCNWLSGYSHGCGSDLNEIAGGQKGTISVLWIIHSNILCMITLIWYKFA